jgi:uridylate kinase
MMTTGDSQTSAKRILVKLSGEALILPGGYGIDPQAASAIAEDIVALAENNIDHCIVVGGGNMFRGAEAPNMDRVTADTIGMLATVMNALALQQAIEALGQQVRVQSAVAMPAICEPYFRRRALRHIEKKRTVIFAAGTGNPYFSTDTAAALRASEMGCSDLFKATKVDGVYDKDPKTHKDAKHYQSLSFDEVHEKHLAIMDNAAIHLCKNNDIPITVFNVFERGALLKAARGNGKHTLIT